MAFGKRRPVGRGWLRTDGGADRAGRSRSSSAVTCSRLLVAALVTTLAAASTLLTVWPASRTQVGDIGNSPEKSPVSMPAPEFQSSPPKTVQPTIIGTEEFRNLRGQVDRKIIRYSDGSSSTSEYTYGPPLLRRR